MKRIIAIVLTLAAVLSMAVIGVSAVTKADLLTEAAKSPVYKHVRVAIENAARTIEITDEQAEKILPIIKKVCAITDKGSSAHTYTEAERQSVMGCVDEICNILGFTYKFETSKDSKHIGDSVFFVYNKDGKLVFQYDGDVVADTDAATTMNTTAVLAASAFLAVLGVAAVAVSKRRASAE